MTARHRKGKSNHKFDENSFKHEALEAESRGGNHYALLFILFLMIVIGGATVAWFCLQQHQTITYLADNLMGVQMKMVKLQTFQEEMRKTNEKLHSSEGFEHRLHALEEAYVQAQKQVGVALATAEQLKTSDLPAQVLSLHTEMKARLEEVQQSAVSTEQLALLQGALRSRSEEFEAFQADVAALGGANADLTVTVEGLSGGLATAESKLEEQAGRVGALASQLEGQIVDLLSLREALALHKAQLEASSQEIVVVRELLEVGEAQKAQLVTVEEQLSSVRHSLEEQNMVAQSLHSELKAQLHAIQSQVKQFEGSQTEEAQAEEHGEQAAPALEEVAWNEPVQEEEQVTAPVPEEVPSEQAVEELLAPVLEEVPSEQPLDEEVTAPVPEEVPSEEPVEEEELAAPVPEEVPSEQLMEEEELPASVPEEAPEEQLVEEEAQAAADPEEVPQSEEEPAQQGQEEQTLPIEEEVGLSEEDLVDSRGAPEEVQEEVQEELAEQGDDTLEEEEQLVEEAQIIEEAMEQTEEGDAFLEQE
ncbi:uncharacterized abhydrolase domain-containing protein DDB_G0269086-like [Anguilla anguilla]|nr:uncharacterized abhydrolase domain-containing protein DDB_G0269086-like [Anguilla anguilla]